MTRNDMNVLLKQYESIRISFVFTLRMHDMTRDTRNKYVYN